MRVRKKRIAVTYTRLMNGQQCRNSMDNPEIGMIYHEFFKEPLSLLIRNTSYTPHIKSK
ncbi:MAG: iron hydrogenase small subunit [Anaerobutyricum soehngenii]